MSSTKKMAERGEQHFKAGKTLGIADCDGIDQELYAEASGMNITESCRHYAKMRKAFNKGWFKAHAASIFAAVA